MHQGRLGPLFGLDHDIVPKVLDPVGPSRNLGQSRLRGGCILLAMNALQAGFRCIFLEFIPL